MIASPVDLRGRGVAEGDLSATLATVLAFVARRPWRDARAAVAGEASASIPRLPCSEG